MGKTVQEVMFASANGKLPDDAVVDSIIFNPQGIWCRYFLRAYTKLFSHDAFALQLMLMEYTKNPSVKLFDAIIQGMFYAGDGVTPEYQANIAQDEFKRVLEKRESVREFLVFLETPRTRSRSMDGPRIITTSSSSSLSSTTTASSAMQVSSNEADIFKQSLNQVRAMNQGTRNQHLMKADWARAKTLTNIQEEDFNKARQFMEDAGIKIK